MLARAALAPSFSMTVVPSSLPATRNMLISPARNPAGPSKIRATGGAPPLSPFAKLFNPLALPAMQLLVSVSRDKCMAPFYSMSMTR